MPLDVVAAKRRQKSGRDFCRAALGASASSPAPLRVAVASNDGAKIDLHFGQADEFRIFDVGAGGAVQIEMRDVARSAREGEDRRDTICRILSDCRVLLVAKIGVTPQEKLAAVGIEATDLHADASVATALAEVYATKAAPISTAPLDTSAFRLAHAMLRVRDLDRALEFYTGKLGMVVLEQREHKKRQFSQVYVGYGGPGQMTLELVFNWANEESYVPGNAFGHIAIHVTNITALCNRLAAEGVAMPRPPRAQRHGENIVAFVEDPDGNRIELVQLAEPAEPS